jgi:thiamine biosynthesis protein ThiS
MRITINGEAKDVAVEVTLAQLVEQLDMQPKYIAVERNRELVPRAQHSACILESGDELEIVTLVGGG